MTHVHSHRRFIGGYNYTFDKRNDRITAERELGKPLPPHTVVHHIDFVPWNDDPKNLLVLSKGEYFSIRKKLNSLIAELIARGVIYYSPKNRDYRLTKMGKSLPIKKPIPHKPDPPDRRWDRLRDLSLNRRPRFFINHRGNPSMAEYYYIAMRVNGVRRTFYIGPCLSMTAKEAFLRARRIKAHVLGLELPADDPTMTCDLI